MSAGGGTDECADACATRRHAGERRETQPRTRGFTRATCSSLLRRADSTRSIRAGARAARCVRRRTAGRLLQARVVQGRVVFYPKISSCRRGRARVDREQREARRRTRPQSRCASPSWTHPSRRTSRGAPPPPLGAPHAAPAASPARHPRTVPISIATARPVRGAPRDAACSAPRPARFSSPRSPPRSPRARTTCSAGTTSRTAP